MSTPTPATPTLTLTTDAQSYVAGQPLTLTAVYADSQSNPVQLTITAQATDTEGNTASANATVTVVETASEEMDVSASDSLGDTYTEQSNTLSGGTGTAVLTTTVTVPSAPTPAS